MKAPAVIFMLAALPSVWLIQAAGDKIIVPAGKTYVKLSAAGKETARYTSGQTMAGTVDCARVPCPHAFGKDVICWKCKEPPESREPLANMTQERLQSPTQATISRTAKRQLVKRDHDQDNATIKLKQGNPLFSPSSRGVIVPLRDAIVVPEGKTYVKLDEDGYEIGRIEPVT